ncbi:MAG: class I SAM-dependent methyltransferase [Candidatus Binatia bacterium]
MHGRNAALIRRYFPTYRSPKLRYQALLDGLVASDTLWLDLGCGRRICADDALNNALPHRAQLAVGADADPYLRGHDSMRNLVRCDASALPFRDGAFNLVTSSFVFEHLERPEAVLREVARVCRPGGRIAILTPNLANYGMIVAAATPYRFHRWYKKVVYYLGRGDWIDHDEDMFPTYYRANTVGRLRKLSREAALEVERLERLNMAHSFGFIKPLYIASLLFERLIDRRVLETFKADILGVFVRGWADKRSET